MERLLTAEMLCIATGFKLQTIYNRLCTGGDLPPVTRLGRALRWREADVNAWIESKAARNTCAHPDQSPLRRRRGAPTKAERIAARIYSVTQDKRRGE
jgi:predicted DNA-binding transcriptional regulator AlpA